VRQREEFVSIASHELRTPLTTLKGYVQLLAREMKSAAASPETLGEYIEALEEQVGRFEALVNDLLDASRAQRGRLELDCQAMDLASLARHVLARFEHDTLRTEKHTLDVDAPAPVVGIWDPARIDQVLTNLISNAIKYSPDGGTIGIRVREEDGAAVVSISDQGVGIAPEEQASLFQPFVRGRAGHGVGGTGLGLYISAQIVERHGGTISVESEPGAGSTFTVRLPRTGSGHPTPGSRP
jgi:signal transduction histidine kinase